MGSNDYLSFYGPSGKLLSIRSVSGTGVTSMVTDRVYFGGMPLVGGSFWELGCIDLDGPAGDGGGGVSVWDGQGRRGRERCGGFRNVYEGRDDGVRVCDE